MPSSRLARWRAHTRAHPLWGDALLMVLLSPVTLLTTISLAERRSLLGFVLGLCCTLPLLWRRSHPDAATAAVAVTHLGLLAAFTTIVPANITVPVMLYAVARHGRARLTRVWLAVALVGSVLAGFRWGNYEYALAPHDLTARVLRVAAWTLTCAAVCLAAWFWGQWARQRATTLLTLRQRAEALEREREQGMRLVAEEERNRLAREMHDIVAHSLSVIVVQSDGAGYLASHGELGDPGARLAQVQRAIETINQTAREALGETRRLVGVLRQDGTAAALAPAATLDQVGALVQQLDAAGFPSTFTVDGDPASHPSLGSGTEMAAYRVVQEALTNVMKHAGPGATVEVALEHGPDGLDVAVRDTGRGSLGTDGLGHGVVGMRERVAARGGSLVARPRLSGGFEVLAHLPATPTPARIPEENP